MVFSYFKIIKMTLRIKFCYSRSFRFGFLDGSLERNPKMNRETKKITVVYTKIFKVNIKFFLFNYF